MRKVIDVLKKYVFTRKVLDILKKYLVIGFAFSVLLFVCDIFSMVRNNTLPTVNLIYIIKNVFGILAETVIAVPAIAILDFCFIYCAKSLFKDYKYADKKGRIIIIIAFIVVLIKKIGDWTR